MEAQQRIFREGNFVPECGKLVFSGGNEMRCWTVLAACTVLIQAVDCLAQQPVWQPTLADARALAAETGVPILVHFTGQNCIHCTIMDREVFADAEVRQSLRTNVAAVMINRDLDRAIAAEFGITGVPADVILYPDGQREQRVGRMARQSYLGLLAQAGRRRQTPPRRPLDSERRSLPRDQQRLAQTEAAAGSEIVREESGTAELVAEPAVNSDDPGMGGYCPVTLRLKDTLQAGRPEFSAVYQGVMYRFSSRENHRKFVESPSKFAPQDLGCDPVILTKEHRAVPGDARLRLWFDGQLYLFSSDKSRQEFRSRPLPYTRMRSAVRVEDLQRTRMQ